MAQARERWTRAPRNRFSPRRERVRVAPLASALALVLLGSPLDSRGDASAVPSPGQPSQGVARERDLGAGARTYAGCAACHGSDGAGRADGTFPRIGGQHASVVVKQMTDIRDGRRGNPIMASHLEALTDRREIEDVAAYVARLSPASDNGRGEHPGELARGAELYRRDCGSCHGAQGEGDAGRRVPVLAGQHYAYLLRQVRGIAGSLRPNAHPGMVEAVFRYRDEDLRAVASYLSQLSWPRRTAGH